MMLVRSSWWTRTDRRTVTFDPVQDVDGATVAVEHAQQSHGLTTRGAGRWTALEDPLDQCRPANPPAVSARGLHRGRSRCGHDVGAPPGARSEHAMIPHEVDPAGQEQRREAEHEHRRLQRHPHRAVLPGALEADLYASFLCPRQWSTKSLSY